MQILVKDFVQKIISKEEYESKTKNVYIWSTIDSYGN
jgi:hypothetical protein